MITHRGFWTRCGVAFIPIAVIVVFVLLWPVPPSPLPIFSGNADFGVSVRCTFGTNHVYYYGDALDRLLDPATRRWSRNPKPPYRLIFDTPDPSTAVWVRLLHSDYRRSVLIATATGPVRYPMGDIPKYRALLRHSSTGTETVLEQKKALRKFKEGAVISGYLLPGPIEAYSGSFLRIESTNGEEVVTFRIP